MRRPLRAALAGALTTALAVTLASAPVAASADPGDGRPTTPPGLEVAQDAPGAANRAENASAALAAAEDLLTRGEAGPDGGGTTGGRGDGSPDGNPDGGPGPAAAPTREATIALRDLALLRDALSPDEQRRATALLARPTSPGGDAYVDYSVEEAPVKCSAVVCVHRVASTRDAATNDFATKVLASVSSVANTYTGAGYRAPRSDAAAENNGGNAKPDIYLADIGGQGIYGYCVPEGSGSPSRFDFWSYCVLDNDFSTAQYPSNTPLENMRVTAAHEFFHAVQFSYDASEAAWFLEATATWAEDEVYDDVNDNVQYLRSGPMKRPARSLDVRTGRSDLGIYGAWSFFRFLTERDTTSEGGMPVLVRSMWRRADSTAGAPDETDLTAVRRAVQASGADFKDSFAAYAEANRHPRRTYEEGKANRYPSANLAGKKVLSGARPGFARNGRFGHLSSRTFRLEPKSGLRSPKWRVRLSLDLPPVKRGSEARVTIYRKDGSLGVSTIRLNGKGNQTTSRPFSASNVRAVEVHLVNASARVNRCYTDLTYPTISCSGVALDDGLPYKIRAKLVRRR